MMNYVCACSLEESDGYNAQIGLDVFKEDPAYQENEAKYEVGIYLVAQPSCMLLALAAKRHNATLKPQLFSKPHTCLMPARGQHIRWLFCGWGSMCSTCRLLRYSATCGH